MHLEMYKQQELTLERSKNEAEAYANDVIPRARGEAAKILQGSCKLINKKLLQLQKVKLVDLFQFILNMQKLKKLLKRECI